VSAKQKKLSVAKPSFGSRVRRAMLRFLLRSWAGFLLIILTALAALTTYQMWRGGLVVALSLVSQFVTNLILIAAVLVIRRLIKMWQSGAIKDMLLEGLLQGQTTIKSTVQDAKGALSSLGKDVKEDLQEIVGGKTAPAMMSVPSAPRCPSCNRFVKAGASFCDGCGAPLSRTCPKCGQVLQPQARFCEACGAKLGSGK
jgi:hypothetical protein